MPEKKPQTQSQDSTPDETQTPPEGALPPVAPQEQPPLEAKPGLPEQPKKLDETVPGGRYKTADGRYVDANNKPLD